MLVAISVGQLLNAGGENVHCVETGVETRPSRALQCAWHLEVLTGVKTAPQQAERVLPLTEKAMVAHLFKRAELVLSYDVMRAVEVEVEVEDEKRWRKAQTDTGGAASDLGSRSRLPCCFHVRYDVLLRPALDRRPPERSR